MKYKSSYLVLAIGLLYLIVIHFFVTEEVFISEDGGIKMLMIKQYLNGNWDNTLVVDAPVWANELWDKGLYYFSSPFVYETPRGDMPVFPPFFSMLNAPFYKAFGFHGLYIIPSLSLVAIWFLFIRTCKRLQVTERATLLSTLTLVFASSLTFYGSVFWEHTLATLCCYIGFYFMIKTESQKQNLFSISFLSGLVFGMAIWFRPESIFVILPLVGWASYLVYRSRKSDYYFFFAGISFSFLIFFSYNYYLFESVTGLHSKQITEQLDSIERVKNIGYIFLVLVIKTILYDPIALFVLAAGVLLRKIIIRDFTNGKSLLTILYITIAFFYVVAPFILPNTGGRNWGIRYALVCIPIFYVAAALILDKILDSKFANITSVSLCILLLYGAYQNVYQGSRSLYINFNGAKTKVINYLQSESASIVLLTKSYQAAEFEVLMPQSLFFKTDTKETLDIFLSRSEIKGHRVILVYDLADNKYKELMLKPEHLTSFKEIKVIENSYTLYELQSSAKAD